MFKVWSLCLTFLKPLIVEQETETGLILGWAFIAVTLWPLTSELKIGALVTHALGMFSVHPTLISLYHYIATDFVGLKYNKIFGPSDCCHFWHIVGIFLMSAAMIFGDNAFRLQCKEVWVGGDPNENHLSYSWGFEIAACILSFISGALIIWLAVITARDRKYAYYATA